jgi:hypothetical protein
MVSKSPNGKRQTEKGAINATASCGQLAVHLLETRGQLLIAGHCLGESARCLVEHPKSSDLRPLYSIGASSNNLLKKSD